MVFKIDVMSLICILKLSSILESFSARASFFFSYSRNYWVLSVLLVIISMLYFLSLCSLTFQNKVWSICILLFINSCEFKNWNENKKFIHHFLSMCVHNHVQIEKRKRIKERTNKEQERIIITVCKVNGILHILNYILYIKKTISYL